MQGAFVQPLAKVCLCRATLERWGYRIRDASFLASSFCRRTPRTELRKKFRRRITAVMADGLEGNKMLHVVYRVGDIDRAKRFLSTLGMHVLRDRDVPDEQYTNVFMGYGPESQGEYFSVELTYNYGVKDYDVGDFGNLGVYTSDLKTVVKNLRDSGFRITEESGGDGLPAMALVQDCTGYEFELRQGLRRDPLYKVTLPVSDIDVSVKFYESLGMTCFRRDKRAEYTEVVMGYNSEGDSTVVCLKFSPGVKNYQNGTGYGQIAVSTPDVYKAADTIENAGFKITRAPGPVPGIGTKITAVRDPDGWKTVLVDAKDFEKEFE